MEIMEWKKLITEANYRKFPRRWSPQDKLISLVTQTGDIGEKIQVLQGIRNFDKRPNDSINQLLIGALIDILVLCDMYNVDIDKELADALNWFNNSEEVR